jgi:alpha-L-rhamnosidase
VSFLGRAIWIGPFDPRQDLGIFVFRRRFSVDEAQELPVWVSADQRYRLYLNGEWIGFGPARGDVMHWSVDPYSLPLKKGENVLHAVVWNFGRWAPMAQISARTGFYCEGDGVDSGSEWEYALVPGRDFDMMFADSPSFYIDIGPGELQYQGAISLEYLGHAEIGWETPNHVSHADPRGKAKGSTPWNLIERPIPAMTLDHMVGEALLVDRTTNQRAPLDGKRERHLIDLGELRNYYPQFTFRVEAETEVEIRYQEAAGRHEEKGDRSAPGEKPILGYVDRVQLTVGETAFEPLWWRCGRYVELIAQEPFEVDLKVLETGYPYAVESEFRAPETAKLWEVSIRTANRCAGETYFDCPYYEQLQYIGDTRIQALVHMHLSRDRNLPNHAIESLAWSRLPEGILQSRYPSRQTQIIPPFALWWILMNRDAWMHSDFDPRTYSPVRQGILDWFEERADKEAWWSFGDWDFARWGWGEPPGGIRNVVHELLRALATVAHAELENGVPGSATSVAAAWLGKFSKKDGLVACPVSGKFSEHAEALYRLLQKEARLPMDPWPAEAALRQADAAECTYYFSYYKHLAQASPDYLAQLGPWRRMLELNLTTFAENPEPTRSDCHAWSAHPALGFFQQIAGITSVAPNWERVRVAPNPGSLEWFEAKLAHPKGDLWVRYRNGKLDVDSPVETEVEWGG